MFKVLDQSSDRCLAVNFTGNPTGAEYKQFLDALDAHLKKGGQPNLVCDVTKVTGYGDAEAFKMDIQFEEGGYKKIHRAALVGDEKWIDFYMKVFAPHTPAEEKQFPAGQVKEAVDWASA